MTTASSSDVRIEIDTFLPDPEIDKIIQRTNRDIEREMPDPPDPGTNDRRDLEAVLSALHIVTSRDRAESSATTGRTTANYETSMVSDLTSRARRLGAPESLLGTTGPDYTNFEVF